MSKKKIIFFIFAAGVGACTAPAQPPPGAAGPVEAVQDFAGALQKGDTATAWSLLSQRTQSAADAAAARARAATDGGPESGRQMLFAGAIPGRSVSVKEVSQTGDSAEVQTADDAGPPRIFHVVRENGRWRVDLDLGR